MSINKSNIKYPSARCLHIVSNTDHLSQELAIQICDEKLDKRQLLTYGLCLHDMDKYTEDDIQRMDALRQKEQLNLYMQYEPSDSHIAEENWAPSPEAWSRAQKEALAKFPERIAGENKPAHLHIVLSFSSSRKVDEIARWFGIEPCFVETKTGRNAVLYALRYLTHNHKGNEKEQKFVYPSSIVHFRSTVSEYENLAYDALLEAVEQKEALYDAYNVSKEVINEYLDKICHSEPYVYADGRKGVYCRATFIKDFTPAVYLRNQKLVDAAESQRDIPSPAERQVYYIGTTCDPNNTAEMSGLGKSSFAKQLARDIAVNLLGADPEESMTQTNPYIFYAGKSGSIFQRYTNQAIVVLDETSPAALRKALSGYEGIKSFLDPHPTSEALDIKFGDVVVNAKYIIMTGILNMDEFINALAGAYTDSHGNEHEADSQYIEQYRRRIWAYVAFNGADNYTLHTNNEFFPSGAAKSGFAVDGIYQCDFKGVQRPANGYILEKKLQYHLMSRMVAPLYEKIANRERRMAEPQYLTMEDYLANATLQSLYAGLGQKFIPAPKAPPKPVPPPTAPTVVEEPVSGADGELPFPED